MISSTKANVQIYEIQMSCDCKHFICVLVSHLSYFLASSVRHGAMVSSGEPLHFQAFSNILIAKLMALIDTQHIGQN